MNVTPGSLYELSTKGQAFGQDFVGVYLYAVEYGTAGPGDPPLQASELMIDWIDQIWGGVLRNRHVASFKMLELTLKKVLSVAQGGVFPNQYLKRTYDPVTAVQGVLAADQAGTRIGDPLPTNVTASLFFRGNATQGRLKAGKHYGPLLESDTTPADGSVIDPIQRDLWQTAADQLRVQWTATQAGLTWIVRLQGLNMRRAFTLGGIGGCYDNISSAVARPKVGTQNSRKPKVSGAE